MDAQDGDETRELEFSIAVLCYRSGHEIVPFVEDLHKILSLFAFKWEIILVANYWPDVQDDTPRVAAELAERLPYVCTIAEAKQGAMGWDMKKGLDACRGRYIGIIDGDGQFPVEAIFSCFAKIKSGGYDFVKTYRVLRGDGFYRSLISNGYNMLFSLLFPAYRGYHDANAKPKIMTRTAYQKMTLRSTDWFIDAEMVLQALVLKLRIYEIPVHFHSSSRRRSFVRPAAVLEFTKNLFVYRFRPVPPKTTS